MTLKNLPISILIIILNTNLHAAWIQTIENKTPYTAHVSVSWDLQNPTNFGLGAGQSRSFNSTNQELKYIRVFIQKPYQQPGAQSGYAGDTDSTYETPYQGNGTWTIVGPFKKPYVGVATWSTQNPLSDEQFEVIRTQ